LADVSHFGIMAGVWEDKDERILNVSTVCEKPTPNYAEEFLSVRNAKGVREYCSVFGQYILTPEVFEQLAADIKRADETGDKQREIELTSALEAVRSRVGMIGVRLSSQRFDMGNPAALVDTVASFSHL
jgi:UTP-glucose-1-phosphate uridylyltransferase